MIGNAMSWREISAIDGPQLDKAARAVRETVRMRRLLGLKNEHAIEDAGMSLDLSPRRVKAWLYGEVFRAARQECRLLLHRWWADMDRQAAELRRRADEIERQAEAARMAETQLSLPLWGGDECSEPHTPHSVSGDGGRR